MILERIKVGLKKRKVKVFSIFLFFSTVAWLIDNLSESFVSETTFVMEYVNTPDKYLLTKKPQATIDVRLKAIGFQFVGFEIRKRKIQIDLSQVKSRDGRYYILPKVYRNQIEDQLPNSMELIEMENDTLFIDLVALLVKKVPVIPRTNISLAKNYMLDGPISIEPSVVTIKGPNSEVDSIASVTTVMVNINNISDDFDQEHDVMLPKALSTTSIYPEKVTISGKVFKFSEKVVAVPVTMLNVPDTIKVRMFPDEVEVLCQGKITSLKSLDVKDFSITTDFAQVQEASENRLPLQIEKVPANLSNATLLTKEIEFILRRE